MAQDTASAEETTDNATDSNANANTNNNDNDNNGNDATSNKGMKNKVLVERIVAVIEQASTKGVSKHKIVKFLKQQNEIAQEDINRGYQKYYEKHHLYEITFNEDKMGFSVIMDPHGKNAIVSSIQNSDNEAVGLKIASRIVEIHGTNVEGWTHRKILDKIQQQKTRPFFIVFREPHKDLNLQTLKKKEANIHKFLTEEQIDEMDSDEDSYSMSESETAEDDNNDNADEKEEDPDVAAVKQHTERKLKAKNKNLVTVATMRDIQWQDDEVAEMEARLREMMEAQNMAPLDEAAANALTHKRRETLMSLAETQNEEPSTGTNPLHLTGNRSQSSLSVSSTGGHHSQYSDERTHAHRVSIMNTLAVEHPDWTLDQIRQMASTMQQTQKDNQQALHEQTQGATSTAAFINSVPNQQNQQLNMMKPVTPSTRAMMTMWSQPSQPSQLQLQQLNMQEQKQDNNNNNQNPNVATKDLLEQMRTGCVMFKRTTKDKLVPRWVEFSPDFQRLRWYSPRKNKPLKTTSVNLSRIQKIHVGKQSSVSLNDKSTAFTLEFFDKKEQITQLTLVAESQQQAFLWFQAIKMCGDAAKRGNAMNNADANAKLHQLIAEKNPNANRSVVLDLPGSDNKAPTVNDLEKLLKRANDLYKKVLPLIQGKKGIVMKSLKKKYPQQPAGALDPNVPRENKSAEAIEYEDVWNSIENVKREMLDKYAKNLSDYKYLLDKLTVEEDDDDNNNLNGSSRGQQLTELKISLFLTINELVSLKVKLVAIARRFQTSVI